MNSTQKQALEKLRQTRLSSPRVTSAQAYAQMDRLLAAQKSRRAEEQWVNLQEWAAQESLILPPD